MPFDYLADFPIPAAALPPHLRVLLEPEGLAPDARVSVAVMRNLGRADRRREHLQMVMAVIPTDVPQPMAGLREAGDGVVSYSTPIADAQGDLADWTPSVSGYDYIVAAWGDASFYGYQLADKVWMALGLSPRCVGGERQRLIYDDLSVPELEVAEGDVATHHEWDLKRDVVWTMSNARLRDYLWKRGAVGARVFFYEAILPDTPPLRAVMGANKHFRHAPDGGWYDLDLREHHDGVLLQVWATVAAVEPVLGAQAQADGLVWPGYGPMTANAANALTAPTLVHLDDRFLERYEQNPIFDTTPVWVGREAWHVSPSYRGQWSFTECVRLGRNVVRVPMRELYKPKSDREIVYAHRFVLDPQRVARMDLTQEHIVAKSQRLLDAFLDMADALASLGQTVGLDESAVVLTGISRVELRADGWIPYPQLARLAQVAPLEMSQQAFLARCKSLHEFWQVLPNGYLRQLLAKAGAPRDKIKSLGTLKLLQGVLNVVQALNRERESIGAFPGGDAATWDARNDDLMGLFVASDLRIADAHEVAGRLERLETLGLDLAELHIGYGVALDRVFDSMISAFATATGEIQMLLARRN